VSSDWTTWQKIRDGCDLGRLYRNRKFGVDVTEEKFDKLYTYICSSTQAGVNHGRLMEEVLEQ